MINPQPPNPAKQLQVLLYPRTALLLYCYCTTTVLLLYYDCTAGLLLYYYCTATVPPLYHHSTATVLPQYCCCITTVLLPYYYSPSAHPSQEPISQPNLHTLLYSPHPQTQIADHKPPQTPQNPAKLVKPHPDPNPGGHGQHIVQANPE